MTFDQVEKYVIEATALLLLVIVCIQIIWTHFKGMKK